MGLLKDISLNSHIQGLLAVKSAQVTKTRSGDKSFINLLLTDGQKVISGKHWDYTGATPTAKVLYIKATVGEYKGEFQLTVSSFREAAPHEYDPKQFLPACPFSIEELWSRWGLLMAQINDPQLQKLLEQTKAKYESKLSEAPGAITHHHATVGGCLHHSIRVAERALAMWEEGLDMDILITGALMHDLGKMVGYKWNDGVFEMSDEGQFLDHIIIGSFLLRDLAKDVDLDWPTTLKLLHVVASHHGKLEYGSPVTPKTAEAFLIHQCDMIDANVEKILKAREETEADRGKVYGFGYVYTGE